MHVDLAVPLVSVPCNYERLNTANDILKLTQFHIRATGQLDTGRCTQAVARLDDIHT